MKAPIKKQPAIKLVWQKNPDGGTIAKYKFGSIIKYKNKYQIVYFGTIGMVSEHASSLKNAKDKLDKISISKIKNQTAMKTPAKKTNSTRKSKLNGTKAKGIVKFTAKNAHVVGIKRDGTLKKGYKYIKGGEVVKVKTATKSQVKKGLGVSRGFCVRRNQDGSTTTYGESMISSNPCPRGGRLKVKAVTMQPVGMTGVKKRKTSSAKQKTAQSKFAINSAKARNLVATGKAKSLKSAWAMLK